MSEQDLTPTRRPWTLFVGAVVLMLAGLLVAHFVQTSHGVSINTVAFEREDGKTIRGLLYTPDTATPSRPAPGILAIHGYINSREVQSGFAIEFARRGYVVLTPDQSGHGYSDAPAFAHGFGGPASLAYLRGLDVVDPENIGLEGHSMGGWAVLAAAATYPEAYKSVVLQGSSTGPPFALDGTPEWPRNLALVFSKYDEFSGFMWGTANAAKIGTTDKLKSVFGTQDDVVAEQIYGDVQAGTARILYQPGVTHPGDHISPTAIGQAVEWFAQTLDGGTPIAAGNQIWMFKEAGTTVALVGFVLLLLAVFELLLTVPYFHHLNAAPRGFAYESRSGKWWSAATISTLIPVLTFYPFFVLAALTLPASMILPQAITTQVVVWALLTVGLLTGIGRFLRGAPVTPHTKIHAALLIAIATALVGYVATWLASAFLHLDFRFWFVGVKLLSIAQAKIALVYLPFFGAYFFLAARALHLGADVASDTAWKNYLSNTVILAGGFFGCLVLQYAILFMTGTLGFSLLPLETIIMHQFVPLMVFIALVGTFTYRRTGSILPGVFINTLIVTWYVVAGQATQYPNVIG
ncbi:MAG: alpha/beta fold hydrolase [Pseudomonadota bacterium]